MLLDIKRKCPYCGETLDGVCETDGSDKNQPRPGDYTVCFECCGLLEFTEDSFKTLDFKDINSKHARNELKRAIRNIERFKDEVSYLN